MTPSRIGARMIYLLALFQLVAGPMVLGLVFAFAKVAVREAPHQGIAKAMKSAWQSDEVQVAVQGLAQDSRDASKSSLPKVAKDRVKMVGVAWTPEKFALAAPNDLSVRERIEAWTPAWPQAPPGTPPRAA